MTKICKVCGAEKPRSEFNHKPSTRDKLRSDCKACQALFSKEYRTKNKVILEAKRKERRYGITGEQFHSMWNEQEGKCWICEEVLSDGIHKHAVDHCHETGRVRGLLCGHCNQGLGRFKDDTVLLHKAIRYLERLE